METVLYCDTERQKKGTFYGMWLWLTLATLCLYSYISDSDEGIFLTPHLTLSTHMRFVWDRSLMKSTLFREQSTFEAVAVCWLPFEGISCNFILRIFYAYAPNDVILVVRSWKWRLLYQKNKVPFPLHLGFHWNFIPCTVHKCTRTSVDLVTALYYEDKLTFQLYLGIHLKDFPEIAYLTLSSHVLKPG
jgi:hypothetical protein